MTSRPSTPGATTPGGNGLAHYVWLYKLTKSFLVLTPILILQQLGDSLGKGAFAQVFREFLWLSVILCCLNYLG